MGIVDPAEAELRLGLRKDRINYLMREGCTEDVADELAVRGGHHPGMVWDSWWDIPILTEEEEEWLEQSKWCGDCRQRHELDRFGIKNATQDGLQHVCREALSRRSRAKRAHDSGRLFLLSKAA